MTDTQALNRQFEKYDQVRKAHTYRLAEGVGDEFDEDYQIATLNFEPFLRGDSADKARFAESFAGALHEIGFAVLTGHGVDAAHNEGDRVDGHPWRNVMHQQLHSIRLDCIQV